jgi:hypothetical protein
VLDQILRGYRWEFSNQRKEVLNQVVTLIPRPYFLGDRCDGHIDLPRQATPPLAQLLQYDYELIEEVGELGKRLLIPLPLEDSKTLLSLINNIRYMQHDFADESKALDLRNHVAYT